MRPRTTTSCSTCCSPRAPNPARTPPRNRAPGTSAAGGCWAAGGRPLPPGWYRAIGPLRLDDMMGLAWDAGDRLFPRSPSPFDPETDPVARRADPRPHPLAPAGGEQAPSWRPNTDFLLVAREVGEAPRVRGD